MTPDRPAPRARHLVPVARASVLVAGALATTAALLLVFGAVALADSPTPVASGVPGASGAPGSGAGSSASGGPAIAIVGTSFQPADLTIQVGQTVTWTVAQSTDTSHSVTSGSSSDPKPGTVFDSGIKLHNDGDSFSFTFNSPGTYPYFCAVHPTTMHGTITVQAAAGGATASPGIDSSKVITAAILVVAIVLLFGWARLYRRMNPA